MTISPSKYMEYDKTLDGRIEQTISRIMANYPEYTYEQLRELFYSKFTDKQVARFRGLWHGFKTEGKIENEEKIKDMLEYV